MAVTTALYMMFHNVFASFFVDVDVSKSTSVLINIPDNLMMYIVIKLVLPCYL